MEALVAAGSNIDPERNLPRAIRNLTGLGELLARSQAWRTPPHGPVEGGAFLNAVLHVKWHADLDHLRHALKRVERAFGREAGTSWKARTIDLDVVAVRDGARKGWTPLVEDLAAQPFLLKPLAEVAPNLTIGNRSVSDLAKAIGPEAAHVIELRVR